MPQWRDVDLSIQDEKTLKGLVSYYRWKLQGAQESRDYAANWFNEEELKAPGVENSPKRDAREIYMREQKNMDYWQELIDKTSTATPAPPQNPETTLFGE